MFAGRERDASVDLVAHLAALDTRPAVYAAQGYGSLFSFCTQALRLSEDAACNRIEAARACRRFPVILDLLASGEVTLTSVRLLGRHLTPENHQAVLAKANRRTRQQIEALVAELAPRPDAPSSVRRLPTFTGMPPSSAAPAHPAYRIGGYTFGGERDVVQNRAWQLGLGADVTFYSKPAALDAAYGSSPVSFQLFLRLRPGSGKYGHAP